MFAGTVGNCAGSDPSKTQAAARPSHNVLSLGHTKNKDRIFISAVVIGWDSTFMILYLRSQHTHYVCVETFIRYDERYDEKWSNYYTHVILASQ